MYTLVEGVCRDEGIDSGTSTSVSKSSRSQLIHIGSITIDLNMPIPVKEKAECQHFSIHGYVSEMKNKDMKICSPFGSSSNPEEQLPPLDVPKFKWWRCDKCFQEIGVDHESAGDRIGDAFVLIGSTTAVEYIFSEMKYMSDLRKGDKSKEIMNDAANTSDNKVISSWRRNKPICDVVGNKTVKAGDEIGSQGVRVEEFDSPAIEVIVPKQCSNREIETNNLVANLLNISTNTEPIPSNGRQRTTSDQIEVLGRKEEVLITSNMKSRGLPSLGSRKGTATSKGSDANLAENILCDLHEDIANDLSRCRKIQKVQLMDDLLIGKDNSDRSCARTMPVVPSKPDTVVAPKDKVFLLEDVGRGIKISQKKKNTTQEDGCRSGMNLDGKMAKILKAFNQNKKDERSAMEIKVTDSHPGENGYDREQHLQSGSKNVKVKHINGKESGVCRNKHKQDQVVGEYFVQMPLEGKNSVLGTNRHSANVLLQ
ncbi:hypothetical protein HAX54_032123 [Datura stramonium]|uniref:Uncharacterized protein n=1 Tax=Datura stramonium TaxID=4076 RepID=A0ABS8VCU9_DATST|nr:hypothetical protein [Datura stramonium]